MYMPCKRKSFITLCKDLKLKRELLVPVKHMHEVLKEAGAPEKFPFTIF